MIEDAIADHHIPGAVLLVGHKGEVVYRKAYGQRSLEPTTEPMTTDTIFDAASLTKPLATAASLMLLYEQGRFRLNDPIARYIPEFGQNGKQEITIRQLFTHYSGLREDLDLRQPWTGKETAFHMIELETPVSPPGANFVYSDINYEMLGFLVEKLSGMTLEKFAAENIFRRLKMEHTRFLPPPDWLPRIAPTEYDEHNVMLRGVVHDPTARRMGGVAGHAGVFTTADDLSRFAKAMLEPDKLLSALALTKMTTPQQPPWATSLRGLGWDIDSPFSSNRGELLPVGSFGHTGFTGTSIWIDPYTQTYIVLLTSAVHPRLAGDSWGKVAIRTKVSNAVAAALDLKLDAAAMRELPSLTGYNEAAAGSRRPLARNGHVLNGIDVLEASQFAALRRDRATTRVGLLTNHTGLTLDGRRTIDVLAHAPGIALDVIFSPEHGVAGAVDATDVANSTDLPTGIRVRSVYGATDAARRPAPDDLRPLDAIVIDIQDVGVRFYTYETTMGYFLEAAAKEGKEVFVLDRPDPITGAIVQGPVSATAESFVNYHPLPVRHGMTMGELAKLFAGERKLDVKLNVIAMQGWERGDWFDSTGQLWIDPSPNMRSLAEATLYPGVALVEGTNVSVGRGTDTPFAVMGAPWISAAGARQLSDHLNARALAGVRFVPVRFTPTASNFAGQICGGIHMVLTDRNQLDAPGLGIEIASALMKLFPQDYQPDKMIQLLADPAAFDSLKAGHDPRRIADEWRDELEKFLAIREKYLIYK